MRYGLAVILFFSIVIANAQFKFDYNGSIPVFKNQQQLKFPWAGGMNNPQFSSIDFDFDGDEDLFIFDRSSNMIILLETVQENGINTYKFHYNGKKYFPSDLRYRVALVDYNGDGKKDIFTYGVGGVKVYKNIGNPVTGLQWELASNLLYSQYVGSYTNLYVSSSDIPAYVDVDGDGDIDILTFHISGERMEYHQNQSVELYGHADSLVYELKNECWGKFTEHPDNNELILNSAVSPCNAPNIPDPQRPEGIDSSISVSYTDKKRHSGSTILALDMDGSSTMDLILGDVSYDNLVLLRNGGTQPNTNSAMIAQDLNFPANSVSASLKEFPAAFWTDVNHDGKKDLLVAPNAKNSSENKAAVLMYENTGTNELPVFEYREKGFLQNDMLEVGMGAIPVFFDYNNDGLDDLILSGIYEVTAGGRKSALQLYKNIGTISQPVFEFVTDDYLSLSAYNWGIRLVPSFGDLDGDGKADLVLGLDNGSVVFFKNTGVSGNEVQFAAPVVQFPDEDGNSISAGTFCFPQIFDLDRDGKSDLILGKQSGELIYYRNKGNLKFELKNPELGAIDVAVNSPEGYAAPCFFRHDDTTYLIVGSMNGAIAFYKGIDGRLDPGNEFELIDSRYLGIHTGAYSVAVINDIDHDGRLDLFVGGEPGGVYHFEHDENSTLVVEERSDILPVTIYPNPVQNGVFSIKIEGYSPDDFDFLVINGVGQLIPYTREGMLFRIEVPPGLYFVSGVHRKDGRAANYKIIVR